MRKFSRLGELAALEGESLGRSDWVPISQEMIDDFADVTGDHQWIHTDPERCRRELDMPTIAHGFLTLSLIPRLVAEIVHVESVKRIVNYGIDKIRFTAPVQVDSRIRCHLTLKRAVMRTNMTRIVFGVEMEIDGSDKPVARADLIALMFE